MNANPAHPASPPSPQYLVELRSWLHDTAARLRAARQFRPLVRVSVALDIVADAAAQSSRLAAAGHRSEVYDLEASIILHAFLGENSDLDGAERQALRRALALIQRSAQADHDISEMAQVSELITTSSFACATA